MSRQPKQHVILCEGFDDRSFWKGWLLHRGCGDPTAGGRITTYDIQGRPIRGHGRFHFTTPSGSSVIVQPFYGRTQAHRAAQEYLGRLQPPQWRPDRVLLNLDSDSEDEVPTGALEQIRGIALSLGADPAAPPPFGIGRSRLYPVVWSCADPESTSGVPRKQTLERLVVASIQAAFPERGPAVQAWLDAEPRGDVSTKSYGYSYLAKWYASHGASDFYEGLWRDEAVASQLEARLVATGAWQIVEDLVKD